MGLLSKRYSFDEIFERDDEGKFNCKIDPNVENKFLLHMDVFSHYRRYCFNFLGGMMK